MSVAYKSTLLSTLIPIRYEPAFETMTDVDAAGVPCILPRGTAIFGLFKRDPKAVVQRVFARSEEHAYTYTGRPMPDELTQW